MQDIKSTTEKHAPTSRAILMAMRIRRYGAERIAQHGRSRATLDATGCHHQLSICPVLPRRTPWSSIMHKKSSCGVVKSLSKASTKKARNGPSTQLIGATSYVDRSNAMIKAEELSNFSSYQTLNEACKKVGTYECQ